eukprot:TRINITY_DN9376_c0_g1_i2.p1 TRINITY_DN9376_c0_g1~~TRINITY_DN9376_c0_g1_i2.p1  ORF type:complete len:507 (+),score=63.26 TRINITY_DN9376_c0_g1_i2:655-2175(+)
MDNWDMEELPQRARSQTCGGDHSIAIDIKGNAYTWGWGEKGALGHGDFSDQWYPRRIVMVTPASFVSAAVGGYGHSILLDQDGNVFTFGWSEFRQLGHDTREDVSRPTKVPGLPFITEITGGGFKHTAVRDPSGQTFVFGDNAFGQLGPFQADHAPLSGPVSQNDTPSLKNVLMYPSVDTTHHDNVGYTSDINQRKDQEDTATIVPNFLSRVYDEESTLALDAIKNTETKFRLIQNAADLESIVRATHDDENDDVVANNDANNDVNHQQLELDSTLSSMMMLGVYDGHGGSTVSNYLKHYLHKTLKQEVLSILTEESKSDLDTLFKEAFGSAFEKVNSDLPQLFEGSTAVACIVSPDYLPICANAGDSLAILVRESGAVELLSEDHRPHSKLSNHKEVERVREAGAAIHKGRVNGQLAVTRSFGDKFFSPAVISDPYIARASSIVSDKPAWLILASDGLYDGLSLEEISKLASTQTEALTLAELLQNEAKKMDSNQDNITILTLRL